MILIMYLGRKRRKDMFRGKTMKFSWNIKNGRNQQRLRKTVQKESGHSLAPVYTHDSVLVVHTGQLVVFHQLPFYPLRPNSGLY